MDRMKLAIESLKTHIDYDNKANGMQTRTITIGIAEAEEILELLKEQAAPILLIDDAVSELIDKHYERQKEKKNPVIVCPHCGRRIK